MNRDLNERKAEYKKRQRRKPWETEAEQDVRESRQWAGIGLLWVVCIIIPFVALVGSLVGGGEDDSTTPMSYEVIKQREESVGESSVKHIWVRTGDPILVHDQDFDNVLRLTAEEINDEEGGSGYFWSKHDILAIQFVSAEDELDGLAVVVNSQKAEKQLYQPNRCSSGEGVVNGVCRPLHTYDVGEPRAWTTDDLTEMGESPENSLWPTDELFRTSD